MMTSQADPAVRGPRTAIDLIGLDADDTLWHNERLYRMGRERFRDVLARAGVSARNGEIDALADQTEQRNITYYGYGVTSFVLSLIEAAVELSGGRIGGAAIGELLELAKQMLTAEVELFDGAREAVSRLAASFPLMVITKGDLLHQRAKIEQSGLGGYFRFIEVVSHKSRDTYLSILERHAVAPARFLMVGNSLRSDVLPVLEIGGQAVYVPATLSWAYEDSERPDAATGRYHEIASLHELPSLVDRIACP